jgi:S-disulfanyl-L-cysteine oxidoreductase SoxD
MNRSTFAVRVAIPALVLTVSGFLIASSAQTANPQSIPDRAQQHRSVWDGIYTEEQANRGEVLYRAQCASCHGEKLVGKPSDSTPALAGKGFETAWKGRSVGDLLKKIVRKMPQGDPGTLTPQQGADLVAFLLRFNQFPAGKVGLPTDESLAAIRFDDKPADQKSEQKKTAEPAE